MKTKIKNGIILIIIIFMMTNHLYCQVITGSKTEVTYSERSGFKHIEIKTVLKNNSTKTISKVYLTVVFKDKYSNSFDLTAPTKTDTGRLDISIPPGLEKEAVFSILEPNEIQWVYKYAKLERVIYSDGSVTDL